MSRSKNNNYEIKAIQFELWQNCNNNCAFCYLNKGRVLISPDKMIQNIESAEKILNDKDRMKQYNCVGFIGGEFFQGQLSTKELKQSFIVLMQKLNQMLLNKEILEVWITASLMNDNLQDLFDSFDCFEFDKFDDDCRIFMCTSYDTKGRFKSVHQKEQWYKNLEEVKNRYPKLFLHTQIITTQSFLEEVESGEFSFARLDKLSGADYKLPGSFRAYYTDEIKNEESYPNHLRSIKSEFPDKFFVEHRDDFIKFLRRLAEFYGIDKLLQFADNKARSMTLISFSDEHTILDRWSEDNHNENAKCGHPYDSYAYLDSNKCARCDALWLYNILTGEE